jgi:histidyl-tRNA synthetase
LNISQHLRDGGFRVDVLLEEMNLKRKFAYVSRKDTQFTIVIGEEEEKSNSVMLQHKADDGAIAKQLVPQSELTEKIKSLII